MGVDDGHTADRLDAIVVGGGLAGVTAARDLARSGAHTLLVEARDRLGGRTAAHVLAGHEIDTGGAYFHWFQSAIWREVMRYELPVVESALVTLDSFLVGGSEGVAAMPAAEFDERLRRGYTAFWGDPEYAAALARPFAVQTDPRAAKLDAISVEERFQELNLDPQDERVLRAILADFGRPDELSLAWVLQRMADGIFSHEAFNALFAVYRLEGTMMDLIDAMVRDGGFEVRLSAPVTAVEHDDSGATVTLDDGSQLSAPVVVVATPVNVWKTIAFTPALGETHEAATLEGVAQPEVSNMLMHVRGVTEPFAMCAPFGELPLDLMVTRTVLEDGQLLLAVSLSGAVTCESPHEKLEAAVRLALPDAELVDFVGHDWPTDPYALGGWGSLRRGQLVCFVDVLDQPSGALFFASADIAPQFPGMLTGAVESGARAGRRAQLALEAAGLIPDGQRSAN